MLDKYFNFKKLWDDVKESFIDNDLNTSDIFLKNITSKEVEDFIQDESLELNLDECELDEEGEGVLLCFDDSEYVEYFSKIIIAVNHDSIIKSIASE